MRGNYRGLAATLDDGKKVNLGCSKQPSSRTFFAAVLSTWCLSAALPGADHLTYLLCVSLYLFVVAALCIARSVRRMKDGNSVKICRLITRDSHVGALWLPYFSDPLSLAGDRIPSDHFAVRYGAHPL